MIVRRHIYTVTSFNDRVDVYKYNLKIGVYFIQIRDGKTIITKKIIVSDD